MKTIISIFVSLLFLSFFNGCTSKIAINKNLKQTNLIQELRKVNFPILINIPIVSKVNSDGRIDIYQRIMNISDKSIKYLYITYASYDDKGENKSDGTIKIVGPIEHANYYRSRYENVFNNSTISCINIKSLKVVFIDGITQEFKGKKFPALYYKGSTQSKNKLDVCF